MPERKRPIFGTAALTLILLLVVAEILVAVFQPFPVPNRAGGESLAIAVGAVANVVITIVVLAAVSTVAVLLAGIGLIRGERRWPAAVAMCLALPSLLIVAITAYHL